MNNLKRNDGSPINDGINNNTYDLLFKDYDNISEKERGNKENTNAWIVISFFTKLQEKKIFTKLLKFVLKNSEVDLSNVTYNSETKEYEYKDNDLVITFDKLSNSIEDKNLIKELISNKRNNKCHSRAMFLSPNIKNSRITTGYITIDSIKVLHSIVEYDKNGETIVLDWTKNLKIEKEQYVKLTKFEELSSFEGKKVIDDIENMLQNLDIGVKPYVVFREELYKDMQKNPHIFKPTDKGKEISRSFREKETDENIKKTK